MRSQLPTREHARHQVIPHSSHFTIRARHAAAPLCPASSRRKPAAALSPPSFPTQPGSPRSEGSLTAGNHRLRRTRKKCLLISIDILPDDVLLEIFYFCVREALWVQAWWKSLVHVCRRWRSVVFQSPNCLNLQLVCTVKTPARATLDMWPALPLLIRGTPYLERGLDNIIAGLERSDRVREIDLTYFSSLDLMGISSSDLEKLSVAMQEPFPELRYLHLRSYGEVVLPDSFLGGSAPSLQFLHLFGIPFPGLPKLLLSATHLVKLHLQKVPHSGYISPDAMFTTLSTLTSLEEFRLGFQSPRSRPDRATLRPPPRTCSVLPILTFFWFKGDWGYLDDLLTHIDAPRLDKLYITFFNGIVFDTPQFSKFICRTPRLKALEEAHVVFDGVAAAVKLTSAIYGQLYLEISCRELDWQVSSLEQVCTSCLPPVSTLEDLYINEGLSSRAHWQDNIENALWLELLHPFRAVKNLYLSKGFALRIVPALQELVGSRATEVLPSLQEIFLEGLEPSGPVQEGFVKFVAARQATSHPLAITRWDRARGRYR